MNKYEIMDMIDEGAYGIVWKAANKETGMLVAIKQFKEGDDDQISKRSIQRQIRMLKMLKGEFIVNIKQAFKKKNKIFLIFQYFPKNLLNLIEIYDHGLNSQLINKVIYKIIKCLRFLHQKNIIHRDIKPQNILLQNDAEELKLCDFGFARFLPEPYEQLTEYVATRWYRSPELLVGQKYGKPADIWALGCILGELVDGQPMFPGQNQMDQLYLIRKCLGQLPKRQTDSLAQNPKFAQMVCPPLRSTQSVEARYIGKIEKNALNFLKACLVLDPSKRITVDDALRHPYLLPFSIKQNQLFNEETNLLYSSRNITKRNQTKNKTEKQQNIGTDSKQMTQRTEQPESRYKKNQSPQLKTKYFADKNSLKMQGGSSLPESSIYKVIHQPKYGHIAKKNSQTNLNHYQNLPSKKILGHEVSPKLKTKKGSFQKMTKVMSEQKKFNYNIDVKLNINVKINQKLNQGSESTSYLGPDGKLPEIKNNSKLVKYRLNNKYPGPGLNTIYNSYGNLSVLGQSKQISKGKKL